MIHVGYGLLVDGKPAGTWPVGLEYATKAHARYVANKPDKKVEIVSVYHGANPVIVNHTTGVFA